jgi:anti-sigma regulatory factor (Ser/Thr protein kinase)
MSRASTSNTRSGFRHEAFFYADDAAFLSGTLDFIRAGMDAGEPTLVMIAPAKIEALHAKLNGSARDVHFVDMTRLGKNPARIIPAWQDFVSEQRSTGRPLRGIGEPIWSGRSHAELVECQHHESLLNLAFADAPPFSLLCPYNATTLDAAVLDEAERSHPFLLDGGVPRRRAETRHQTARRGPFDLPLPDPSGDVREMRFDGAASLCSVRRFVSACATNAGCDETRAAELVIAAEEVASNSVRHGGGSGVLRIWQDGNRLICEVRDGGTIDQPMIGRERPGPGQEGGRGLWIANQLCDLVQIRSFAHGTTVRCHMERRTMNGSSPR